MICCQQDLFQENSCYQCFFRQQLTYPIVIAGSINIQTPIPPYLCSPWWELLNQFRQILAIKLSSLKRKQRCLLQPTTSIYVFQEQALFYSLYNYKIANSNMIHPHQHPHQYFAYNSLLTQNGTRIRRLRRTEVTAEKIAHARIRSPLHSPPNAFMGGFLRDNKSSQTQANRTNSRSKLLYRYGATQRIDFDRENQQQRTYERGGTQKTGYSQQPSQYGTELQSKRSVKEFLGEYYISSNTDLDFKKKSPKRTLRRLESHESNNQSIGRIPNNKYLQQSDYLSRTSNLPYIPKCVNKQPKYPPEPSKQESYQEVRKQQEKQRERGSLVSSKGESRHSSKVKSHLSASIVSRSSYLSRQASNAALSIEGSKKLSRNQSQVDEYCDTPSQYAYPSSAKQIRTFQQLPAYYNKKEMQTQNYPSKRSDSASQLSLDEKMVSQQRSVAQSSSKCSNRSREPAIESRANQVVEQKPQKIYMTKKSTSADQSYNSNEIENKGVKREVKVSEFNKGSKEVLGKKLNQILAMSDTKDNKLNKERPKLPTTTQKPAPKFNPQLKTESPLSSQLSQQKNTTSQIKQSSIHPSKESSHHQNNSQIKSMEQSVVRPIQLRAVRPIEQTAVRSIEQKGEREITESGPKRVSVSSVLKEVEEHQMRLGFIYLFVDNTHEAYQGAIQFQRYERLCFLMLKKYILEKSRVIQALRGGPNCFKLSGIGIAEQQLRKHLNSSLLSEKIADCEQEREELLKELKAEWMRINKKYSKDKLVRLEIIKDNFTQEIVKLLMEELTKLYQELQSEEVEHDLIEDTQKRITQIIEIMFLLSELNGRAVKHFELLSQQTIDFDQYYALNYEKIIETHQYFVKTHQ